MKRKQYSAEIFHHKTFDTSMYEIPKSTISSLLEDQRKVFKGKIDIEKLSLGQCENFSYKCMNCHQLKPEVKRRK